MLDRAFSLDVGKHSGLPRVQHDIRIYLPALSKLSRRIPRASVFKRFVIATLEGINDVDQAAALKETVVFALRDDLPIEEGCHFISDLIGLPLIDAETNKEYGILDDVINTGASDIYVVKTPDGERMMPAVPEFVKEVDTERGIFISPIEGMFD